MAARPETIERVRTILERDFAIEGADPGTELLDSGYVDSPAIVELVTVLEETFGIVLSDDQMTPENFGSPAGIAMMVEALSPGLPATDG